MSMLVLQLDRRVLVDPDMSCGVQMGPSLS